MCTLGGYAVRGVSSGFTRVFPLVLVFFISSSVLVFFHSYLVFFMGELNVINCTILCNCNSN